MQISELSSIEGRYSEYDIRDPDVVAVIDDMPIWSAPFGLALLDAVQLKKNIRALDIGSGLGFPLIELAQRLGESCEVYGIDPWEQANERVRKKCMTWKLKNIQVITGKAEHLPFTDGFFHLIVSNNGTNNVDNDKSTFSEIFRVAKPDAQIVLTMNLPDTFKEFYLIYREVLQGKKWINEREKLEMHIQKKRKPLSHIITALESAGLEVIQVQQDAFYLRYSDGSTMLNSPFIRLAFKYSWMDVLDPNDVGLVFAKIEGRLNHLAEISGELRLTVPWVCLNLRKPYSPSS
ncbi:class I SAM-dependent methyltransferase [Gemmatimonadota bacterium]